jgi:hypothetical protein
LIITINQLDRVVYIKFIGTIEGVIICARVSTTSLKFDGNLESTAGTEIGNDRFVTLFGRKVEDLCQETAYYIKNDNDDMVDLIVNSHTFTIDTVIKEFKDCKDPTHVSALDDYKLDEIGMS